MCKPLDFSMLNVKSRKPIGYPPGMKFRSWAALALSILILGEVPLSMRAADRYAVKLHGQTIGVVDIDSYETAGPDGHAERVTEIRNHNRFSRQGTPFDLQSLTRYVEDSSSGSPLSFSHRAELGDEPLMLAEGSVQGNALGLRLVQNNAPAAGSAPIAGESFAFAGGERIEQLYSRHFQDPEGSNFRFQTLNLAASPEIVDTEVTAEGLERDPAILALAQADAPETPGGAAGLRRFAVRNPVDQNSTVYEWRNAQGKLYRAQSPGNGMEMVFAQQAQVNPEVLDLVSSTQVLTNVIAQPRKTYEALYRIAPLSGRSVDWRSFPESVWQRQEDVSVPTLQSATPNQLYLRVKQVEPPDAAVPLPIRIDDPRYLQATPYMQSTDELVERTAQDIVGSEKRAYFAARMLRDWVYKNITHKSLRLGLASARETLVSREGDCTEHAVLLAALARSLKIPSRVAIGLVYVPENSQTLGQFVYHMWTEVYIGDRDRGQWYPLDASFPEAMPDATHIKLADSALTSTRDVLDLSNRIAWLMGQIRIDVVKALSPAGSVLSIGADPNVTSAMDIPKFDIQKIDLKTLSRKAIKHYRVELPPRALSLDSPEGLFTHGVELLSKGQYDEAVDAFRKAAAKTKRPAVQYRLAERLASIEMYDLARENFDRAAQADRRFAPLVDSWYSAFFPRESLSPEAQRRFAQAVGLQTTSTGEEDDVKAADLLKQVYQEFPRYVPVLMHLGSLAERNGYYKEASQDFAMAASVEPALCNIHERQGDAAMQEEKYQAASQYYAQTLACYRPHNFVQSKTWTDDLQAKEKLARGAAMLAANAKSATGWLETGKALYMQQRYPEAASAIRNALAYAPNSAEARLYQFKLLYQDNRWLEMQAAYGRLGTIAQRHAHAAFVKGLYEMRTRQYPRAVQSLKRAIAMDPATPDPYITLAETYQRVGELESKASQYNQYAETTLRTGLGAMRSEWNRYRMLMALGNQLFENGKAEDARLMADQALDINPVSARAYRLKGQAQLYAGDVDAARDTLETALALDANDVTTLTFLGHTAEELGQVPVALDYYLRANKTDPADSKAAEALRSLIVQHNLAAKKPKPVMTLSPDERDYVIQLFALSKQSRLYRIQNLEALNQLIGSDFAEVNIKNILNQPVLVESLNDHSNRMMALYKNLRATKAPVRLGALHNEMQRFLYNAVIRSQANAQYYEAGWVASKALENLNKNLEEMEATAETDFASLKKHIDQLGQQITPDVLAALRDEGAGYDVDQSGDRIQQLEQALKDKLTPKDKKKDAPAEKKPPQEKAPAEESAG